LPLGWAQSAKLGLALIPLDPLSSQHAVDIQARLSQIESLLNTDPAQAESEASELLSIVPEHQMAMLFQGIARRLRGNAASAIEVLTLLSASSPDAPLVHLQLGLALHETGQNDRAIGSLHRAVKVKPDFGDAWLALADILIMTGDNKAADAAFTQYVNFSTSDPLLIQAANALKENRISEAEAILRGNLEQNPIDIVALCLLADVAERTDGINEAEVMLQRCLELSPSYRRARHNYAVILMRQNKITEALRESNRLLADEPKNREVRKLKAAILVRLRDYDESITICESLLNENSNEPAVWTSLGHMLKTVGRREECIGAYEKAIALAPHFGEPYWSLANLKTLQFSDEQLKEMRVQLNKPNLAEVDRLHFHFAIGKALEDRGEFDESFQNYAAGNQLRLNKRPYTASEMSDHVRRCKSLFSAEFFAARADAGANAADPIFILGMPRAGSTLVEQILASHSDVEGTMELSNMVAIAKSLDQVEIGDAGLTYPEVLVGIEEETFRQLGQSYIEQTRVQRKLGTPYFIDKMPNNFAHIGLIHLILPKARIIDIRRHPLACGFSLFKEHFAGGQNYSYSLEEIGRYYQNYVELMAHFDAVLPGRVHRLYYESLVDDTETEVRRLLDFCALPYEANCLHFYKNDRAVSTASSEQVRQPISRAAIDHWRNYEPWLDALKLSLGSLGETYPDIPEFPGSAESVSGETT
jgi:predicted Zn-dependent protease